MKNYIIRYGVIGGLISSIIGTLNWILIADTIGVTGSQTVGYLTIFLSLMCIPFGVRYFRDQINNGAVSFRQAFTIGLGITSIAGVVMAIQSALFFALQKEEFIEWQRKNLSDVELAAFNEQLAHSPAFIFSPWFQAIVMFVMVFLIGAVVNVVSALILKQEE